MNTRTIMGWRIDDLKIFVAHQRTSNSMSIREAAADTGISPTTLCKIENGHIPDTRTLIKVLGWIDTELAFYEP